MVKTNAVRLVEKAGVPYELFEYDILNVCFVDVARFMGPLGILVQVIAAAAQQLFRVIVRPGADFIYDSARTIKVLGVAPV